MEDDEPHWDDLIEHGTVEDIYIAAKEAMRVEDPVPVDAMAKLEDAGYFISEQ